MNENKTIEEKVLEHIGRRLEQLDNPTKLEKEKQGSAKSELKMILEIFQKR